MWIFRRDPNQLWITQAVCPKCSHVNAAHINLKTNVIQDNWAKEHIYCFKCEYKV